MKGPLNSNRQKRKKERKKKEKEKKNRSALGILLLAERKSGDFPAGELSDNRQTCYE